MIRNEICCDVCGSPVARKIGLILARYVVIRPYVEVPYHDIGVSCDDGYIPSKTKKHICNNCMEKFVYKALDENAEQMTKRWMPKKRDKYYYLDEGFHVKWDFCLDCTIDDRRIDNGNCFETEEEAEDFSQKVKNLLTTGV